MAKGVAGQISGRESEGSPTSRGEVLSAVTPRVRRELHQVLDVIEYLFRVPRRELRMSSDIASLSSGYHRLIAHLFAHMGANHCFGIRGGSSGRIAYACFFSARWYIILAWWYLPPSCTLPGVCCD